MRSPPAEDSRRQENTAVVGRAPAGPQGGAREAMMGEQSSANGAAQPSRDEPPLDTTQVLVEEALAIDPDVADRLPIGLAEAAAHLARGARAAALPYRASSSPAAQTAPDRRAPARVPACPTARVPPGCTTAAAPRAPPWSRC